jgi:gluconolactonase
LAATALAQKVEIGNLAYEKNPPYPEAQNPQLPLEVYDDAFAEILGKQPQLIHLANGFGFTEGPVYLQVKNSEAGYLVFTDQINDNINLIRWHGLTP